MDIDPQSLIVVGGKGRRRGHLERCAIVCWADDAAAEWIIRYLWTAKNGLLGGWIVGCARYGKCHLEGDFRVGPLLEMK